jgi:hypothetical protein
MVTELDTVPAVVTVPCTVVAVVTVAVTMKAVETEVASKVSTVTIAREYWDGAGNRSGYSGGGNNNRSRLVWYVLR